MIRNLLKLILVLLSFGLASEPAFSVFAQDSTPQAPASPQQSQASTWDFIFTVTKGNITDRKRLAFLQGEYRCVAAGNDLICRSTDGKTLFSGSMTGNDLELALEKHIKPTTSNLVDCYLWAWCPEVGGYSVSLHLHGQIAGQAANGNWNAVLRVGSTDYPVKGTWKAIRVDAAPTPAPTPPTATNPPVAPPPLPTNPPVATPPAPTSPGTLNAPTPSTPSPAPSTSIDPLLITPGQGIGSVRLGLSITDVTAVLGRPKVTLPYSKTNNDTIYAWFDYTGLEGGTARFDDGGLMVVCSQAGQVTIVQAYYAPQYVTAEGLHTGMTEDQVRAALGEPTKVEKFSEYHSLEYLSQGITFRIEDDPHVRGYRTVYIIKVYPPKP